MIHDPDALGLKWKGPVRLGAPAVGFAEYVALESLVLVSEEFVFGRIRAARALGVNVRLMADSEHTFSVTIGGGLTAIHVRNERAFAYFRAMGFVQDHPLGNSMLINPARDVP
jgi:hypothetical protein